LELLEAEKVLMRRSDELGRRRQQLPWVRIEKEYWFDTDEGSSSSITSCSATDSGSPTSAGDAPDAPWSPITSTVSSPT
jgi:hypothetical protein